MKYQVIDRNGEPVSEQVFDSERKAYEAMRVYRENCFDIALPMKVVKAISSATRALAEDTFALIERSSR